MFIAVKQEPLEAYTIPGVIWSVLHESHTTDPPVSPGTLRHATLGRLQSH